MLSAHPGWQPIEQDTCQKYVSREMDGIESMAWKNGKAHTVWQLLALAVIWTADALA